MKLQAIAFDLDGTLYPNSQLYWYSIPYLLGIPRIFQAYSKVRKEIRQIDDIQNLYELEAKLLGSKLNKDSKECEALLQETIYGTWLSVFKKIKLFPNVLEVLTTLKEEFTVPIALMSDFPLNEKLNDLNLDFPWDLQFSTMETNYLKPSKIPFLNLAERLNCSPKEICYIGNNYKYDVLGAKNTGMKTGLISSKNPRHFPEADFVFSQFNDLPSHIRNLNF